MSGRMSSVEGGKVSRGVLTLNCEVEWGIVGCVPFWVKGAVEGGVGAAIVSWNGRLLRTEFFAVSISCSGEIAYRSRNPDSTHQDCRSCAMWMGRSRRVQHFMASKNV